MITPDGWFDWMERVPGPADKVYSEPCTSEIVVFHDAVGYLPGWYSRLFSTNRLPNGLYTPYAAASVTGWLFYDRRQPIQHYPVFKSCWASGSRHLNTKGNAFENESAPGYGTWDPHSPPPQSDWQVECAARVEHDIAAFKGWPEGYWRRPVDANDLTATEYEHNETVRWGGLYSSCPNGRIRWADIAALRQEEDMSAYDAAIIAAVNALRDGDFVKDDTGTIYKVEKPGDTPELWRIDDSKAGLVTSTPMPVPLGVAMLYFHGRQVT